MFSLVFTKSRMAHFKDLEPFSSACEALTAVGWLTRDVSFDRGDVPPEFFTRLKELCAAPWQFVVSMGLHPCDLCQFDALAFTANLYVPYQGRIYVAPVGITHYVAAHWYRPPDVFVQAVMECPKMDSMAYKKALLENGGRGLVRAGFADADAV
jgi:hypothetical protein